MLSPLRLRAQVLLFCFLLIMVCTLPVHAQQAGAPEPAVYLNFDEGSGTLAIDSSGQGNAGTLHNVSRIDSGGCSRALAFENPDGYVSIPYRALNHPEQAITVSAWFYADNFTPAVLVSSYHDGGYRLAFDDGNDLWWTVNLEGSDVSIPVQHDSIAAGQWHHVTGIYDGTALKVYLDGILRNQANASGTIHYEDKNYVILGADAGPADIPAACPHSFSGALDEIRIYPVALDYNQVMDDRFQCSETAGSPEGTPFPEPAPATCEPVSGSVTLEMNGTVDRVLSFANGTVNGTWKVSLPPGSLLSARADDFYANAYPDEWYLEIAGDHGAPVRTIAFPGRKNAPAESVVPSGNATVTLRHFSGTGKFPARVLLGLESLPARQPPEAGHQNILENPIIVIYSASWATLVAILLVIIWLNRRKKARMTDTKASEHRPAGIKKL